jgi:hypothetical protein
MNQTSARKIVNHIGLGSGVVLRSVGRFAHIRHAEIARRVNLSQARALA